MRPITQPHPLLSVALAHPQGWSAQAMHSDEGASSGLLSRIFALKARHGQPSDDSSEQKVSRGESR